MILMARLVVPVRVRVAFAYISGALALGSGLVALIHTPVHIKLSLHPICLGGGDFELAFVRFRNIQCLGQIYPHRAHGGRPCFLIVEELLGQLSSFFVLPAQMSQFCNVPILTQSGDRVA